MESRKYATGMKTNKGKKYWTKYRQTQFNYWITLISVVVIAVAVIGFADTYTTKYLHKMQHRSILSFQNPFHIAVAKAENITEPVIPEKLNESTEQTIRRLAKENNFKWTDYLVRLANCESRLNPDAVNSQGNKPATSKDRGLFQINDYFHRNVTDVQAFDVEFSTKYTMDLINQGKQELWVCNSLVLKNPTKYNPK